MTKTSFNFVNIYDIFLIGTYVMPAATALGDIALDRFVTQNGTGYVLCQRGNERSSHYKCLVPRARGFKDPI